MAPKKRAKKLARNVRAAAKQTAKQAKNIKRNLKEVAKQAKRVVKAVKKKAPEKKSPRAPRPPKRNEDGVYELRDAPYSSGRTVLGKFASIERNADKFDTLKDASEYWSVNIFGHRTKQLFRSARALRSYMLRYEVFGDDRPDEQQRMIDEINIARFGGSTRQYRDERMVEAQERQHENQNIFNQMAERFGRNKTNPRTGRKQRKSSFDFIKDQQAEIDRLQQTMAAQIKAAVAEAMQSLTPPEPPKPTKKRAAKKTAKKKAIASKVAAQKAAAHKRSVAAKKAAATRAANAEAKRLADIRAWRKRNKAAQQRARAKKGGKR